MTTDWPAPTWSMMLANADAAHKAAAEKRRKPPAPIEAQPLKPLPMPPFDFQGPKI